MVHNYGVNAQLDVTNEKTNALDNVVESNHGFGRGIGESSYQVS